jgi:DNA-binding MarR family transcriptional regulator
MSRNRPFCYTAVVTPQSALRKRTSRIEWLSDLIRLEIALWDRIDARLRNEHDLPLAFFESLFFIGHSPDGRLQVGELARAIRITVGGASKVVDRIEAAGLIRREAVVDDRRACHLVLTAAGKRKLASASETYEAEMAAVLDAALTADQQRRLHGLVTHLLTAVDNGTSA